MYNIVLLFCLLTLLPACKSFPPQISTLTIHDSKGAIHVDIQHFKHGETIVRGFTIVRREDLHKYHTVRDDLFHFVNEERFRNFKFTHSLSYLGTEKGFHLLRHYSKFTNGREQIFRFAIRECEVKNSRTVTEEFRKHTASYRRVDLSEGKCTVK